LVNIHCNEEFRRAFPGLDTSIVTLPINFCIPLWREYVTGLGINSCDKNSLINRLNYAKNGGHAVIIAIGGAEEFVYMEKGMLNLI
jgi:hypothetical protein